MREIEERELKLRQRRLEAKLTGESVKPPEIWVPNFGGLTISGPSGTGKTTTGLEMVIKYDIPVKRFRKVGAEMREDIGDMLGYQDRPLSKDIELDELQALLIREARVDNPLILEGRLAGIFKAEEVRKAKETGIDLPVVSLLFICELTERISRITNRWNENNPNDQRTLQEVKKSTLEREKRDLETWQKAHPELVTGNPFNPGLRDKSGKLVYDKHFSTTGKSIDEVAEEIHRFLKEKGFIKRVA